MKRSTTIKRPRPLGATVIVPVKRKKKKVVDYKSWRYIVDESNRGVISLESRYVVMNRKIDEKTGRAKFTYFITNNRERFQGELTVAVFKITQFSEAFKAFFNQSNRAVEEIGEELAG